MPSLCARRATRFLSTLLLVASFACGSRATGGGMGAADEAGAPDAGAPVVSYCADATMPKRIAAVGLTFMDLDLRGGTLVAAGITDSEINPPHNDGAVVAVDLATSASRALA